MAERMSPFEWNPNIGAINGFGIRLNGKTYSADIAATTNTTLTVPKLPSNGRTQCDPRTGKNLGYAIFGYEPGVECWVSVNNTAVPNTTGSFVLSYSVLNPQGVLVYEDDILNFYSTPGCKVSVTFKPWA